MDNINLVIIVCASVAALAAVFVLYAIMMFKGVKKEKELQLTTKNVLEQVKILFDKKEYALVELLATKYLERVPSHNDVRKYLLKVYFQQKKYNSAIKQALILLNKMKSDYDTMMILGSCYIANKNLAKAIAVYEDLFDKHSRDNEVIRKLADLYVQAEDLYSAVSAYNILLNNTSENDKDVLAEIYMILSELNEQIGDYPAAHDAYKARLEILPSDLITNKKLAQLYIKLRDNSKSIEVLLFMLTFVSDMSELRWIYETLIDLYVQGEQYQNAIDYSEKLLEIQGADKSKIRQSIAKYKIYLGRYQEGITIYEELAVLSQNDYAITLALAEAYIACKDYDKAMEHYMILLDKATPSEAKEIRVLVCDLYVKMAEVAYDEEKDTAFFSYLDKAKEYNVVNPEIYYHIARGKSLTKNYQEAVEFLKTALEYDKAKTNHIKYLLFMADVQHELGNQFEEKKAVTDLLRLDNNNVQGLLRTGIMYFAQHDVKSAEEYFKKVLDLDADCDDAKYNLALIYEASYPDKARELYIEILEHNPAYKEAKTALEDMSTSNY